MKKFILSLCFCLTVLFSFGQEKNPMVGSWDLSVDLGGNNYPSWLEVNLSGVSTYVGRFVASGGSARPVSEVIIDGNKFSFTIPPQWNPGAGDLDISGEIANDKLSGNIKFENGDSISFTGVRAPTWEYKEVEAWGEKTSLFNGKDLSGWDVVGKKPWAVEEGILIGSGGAANIITKEKFTDFKLRAEFRYPEGSNSGVYLRGRYELQIADNFGLEPSSIYFGGIYGFLTPNEMAAKQAGEWQEYDITLIGRRITIVANGKEIITNQNIPGMTGGALDNNEAEAGPILIQGDHGPVEFRSIIVTPVIN